MPARAIPLEVRFWKYVEKSPECWEWTGNCPGGRYGHIKSNGKTLLAHRLSYQLNVGAVPEGKWILHTCDNPRCVRPDHLYPGTGQQNVRDKFIRSGYGFGERHGSATIRWDDAAMIREAMNKPDRPYGTMAALCRRYNLSTTQVQRIAKGLQWKS